MRPLAPSDGGCDAWSGRHSDARRRPASRILARAAAWIGLGAAALLVAGCASGTGTGAAASVEPAPVPTDERSSATPAASPVPALVGTWVGMHECQRIVDALTGAGLDDQAIPNIIDVGVLPGVPNADAIKDPSDPCAGSVAIEHSHFFTADGRFGSLDDKGRQVDDGTWSIVDSDTFAIGSVPFDYTIDGDVLRMTPVSVGTCPPGGEWCENAWKVMVAMPGMAWTREP